MSHNILIHNMLTKSYFLLHKILFCRLQNPILSFTKYYFVMNECLSCLKRPVQYISSMHKCDINYA